MINKFNCAKCRAEIVEDTRRNVVLFGCPSFPPGKPVNKASEVEDLFGTLFKGVDKVK